MTTDHLLLLEGTNSFVCGQAKGKTPALTLVLELWPEMLPGSKF